MAEDLKPYAGDGKYVFISYPHRAWDRVMPIIAHFIAAGINVWYDSGIKPNYHWTGEIAEKILGAEGVIFMVCRDFIKSENCRDELGYTKLHGKNYFAVFLEEMTYATTEEKGVELQLNARQNVYRYKYASEEEAYRDIMSAPFIEPCRVERKYAERASWQFQLGTYGFILITVGPEEEGSLYRLTAEKWIRFRNASVRFLSGLLTVPEDRIHIDPQEPIGDRTCAVRGRMFGKTDLMPVSIAIEDWPERRFPGFRVNVNERLILKLFTDRECKATAIPEGAQELSDAGIENGQEVLKAAAELLSIVSDGRGGPRWDQLETRVPRVSDPADRAFIIGEFC